MDKNQKWIDWIKGLPAWVTGTIGLATAIISFVVLFQQRCYTATVVLALLFASAILCLCIYIAFAKTPPLIEGGKGVYRHENLRPWAIAGVFVILLAVVSSLVFKPSRSFIATAFIGTATPTSPVSQKIIKLKVFNFSNYSEEAVSKNIGERFPGVILDGLLQKEMLYREENVSNIIEHALHIFQSRGRPSPDDSNYYNDLAPAVLVQGYVEDGSSEDAFVAHTRVSFVDKRISNVQLGTIISNVQLGNVIRDASYWEEAVTFTPLIVKQVTFQESEMVEVAEEQAEEIYHAIRSRWNQFTKDAEQLIQQLYSDSPDIYGQAGIELVRYGVGAVPGLIEGLDSDEESVRVKIVQVLGELRSLQTLPVLIDLLDDKSPRVRLEACYALWNLADGSRAPVLPQPFRSMKVGFPVSEDRRLSRDQIEPAIEKLHDLLDDSSLEVARTATVMLIELNGPESVDVLRLLHENAEERDFKDIYALALGRLREQSSMESLRELARQTDDYYAKLAAIYAGRMGERSLDGLLVDLLEDDDVEIRAGAADALRGTTAVKAFDPLVENTEISEARETLVSIGDPVVPSLIEALEPREEYLINWYAAEILGKIGGNEALDALLEYLDKVESSSGYVDYIVQALGEIGDERAIEPLFNSYARAGGDLSLWSHISAITSFGEKAKPYAIEYLSSPDDNLRLGSARVLESLAQPEDVPILIEHLADSSSRVRWYIVMALAELQDERAVDALILRLDDEDWRVREYAAEALGVFGGEKAIVPLRAAMEQEEDSYRKAKLQEILERLEEENIGFFSESNLQPSRGSVVS